MTTTATPATLTPEQLAEQILALHELPLDARARAARALAELAPRVLAEIGDAAIYTMTRNQTYPDVAEALGVSHSAVNKAVQRHRLTTGGRA